MTPLTPERIAEVRRLRYEDGLTALQTARIANVHSSTVYKVAPTERVPKVSNHLARDLFLASGRSAASVASSLGWFSEGQDTQGRVRPRGDSSRVLRTLGLRPESNGPLPSGGRRQVFRQTSDPETLGLIAEACGAQAWEATDFSDEQVAA